MLHPQLPPLGSSKFYQAQKSLLSLQKLNPFLSSFCELNQKYLLPEMSAVATSRGPEFRR